MYFLYILSFDLKFAIDCCVNIYMSYLQPDGDTKRDGRALDCGAGIGRITKNLLTRLASKVDMVEVNQAFLSEAKSSYLGAAAEKVENYFCSGLQDFVPEEGAYDIIWAQWVLGQLRDDHLVEFFRRCKKGLAENGMIFFKENINSKKEEPDFDEDDSSYCRSRNHLVSLIEKAGLTIQKEEVAKRFPRGLYEVRSFACR